MMKLMCVINQSKHTNFGSQISISWNLPGWFGDGYSSDNQTDITSSWRINKFLMLLKKITKKENKSIFFIY